MFAPTSRFQSFACSCARSTSSSLGVPFVMRGEPIPVADQKDRGRWKRVAVRIFLGVCGFTHPASRTFSYGTYALYREKALHESSQLLVEHAQCVAKKQFRAQAESVFPFRKRSLPFETVDAIYNGRLHTSLQRKLKETN